MKLGFHWRTELSYYYGVPNCPTTTAYRTALPLQLAAVAGVCEAAPLVVGICEAAPPVVGMCKAASLVVPLGRTEGMQRNTINIKRILL